MYGLTRTWHVRCLLAELLISLRPNCVIKISRAKFIVTRSIRIAICCYLHKHNGICLTNKIIMWIIMMFVIDQLTNQNQNKLSRNWISIDRYISSKLIHLKKQMTFGSVFRLAIILKFSSDFSVENLLKPRLFNRSIVSLLCCMAVGFNSVLMLNN